MAETRPTGEQLRFLSSKTGDHILDTYLEAAEIGDRQLFDLLDDLFDPNDSGKFRANNFEFRYDASTFKVQTRVGQFANSTDGWTDLTFFFNQRSTFSNSNTYQNFDIVTLSTKDVYIVSGLSAGTTYADEAAFIASSNTTKIVDVSEAKDWASKVDGQISSTDYSAKAYAIGGTGVTNSAGAAKEWAAKAEDSTVDGTLFSSLHYAAKAAASKTAAETAKTAAETAETNAETAETNAETAQAAAETAKTGADTAKAGADTAKAGADTAKAGAETAQAAAEAALDSFDDVYLGAKSSDPTQDNDGDALTAGDLYFNTTSNVLKYYTGSAWQAIAADTDIKVLVSANDTTAGYLNGKLVAGTNITFTEGSDGGDETLTLAGTTFAATGANSDITSLSALSTALSIAQGGTGQTSAAAALTALGGTTSAAALAEATAMAVALG
tara:strand:- start:1512 stop:2834 length:1323 start_codon:yes stop_codon:yes gene_type:complete